MSREQQGDVILYQSVDDGDIIVKDGLVAMDGGLQTAAYISLFGGNEDDSGADKDPHQWWGNMGQRDKYRSETQYLLNSLPPSGPNLKRLEDAAARDLNWFFETGVATSVNVKVTIPAHNSVKFVININNENYTFTDTWSASK